jgi:hypothetical protein
MTQTMQIAYLVKNDTAPEMRVRFLGLDLSDFDSIAINVERQDGNRFSRSMSYDPDDLEVGLVRWVSGDLSVGDHLAEFEFIQGPYRFTLPARAPVTLRVRRELL